MASSITADASFHPYPRLPYELQLMIIEEFLGSPRKKWHNERRYYYNISEWRSYTMWRLEYKLHTRLGSYATIDILWQSAVEKLTFCALRLRDEDLSDLKRICVGPRINTVLEIQLCISLDLRGTRSTDPLLINGHGPLANNISETQVRRATDHAEQSATRAFRRFFRIVGGWRRDGEPLSFYCDFYTSPGLPPFTRLQLLPVGSYLRINSSSFPSVPCIGAVTVPLEPEWTIQPASMFRLLTRLPNVQDASVALSGELDSPEIVQGIQDGHAILVNSRASELKVLRLESTSFWPKRDSAGICTAPSPQLSQAIFDLTIRAEEIHLSQVVDVPYFLRDAWNHRGSTSQSLTTWPNLTTLDISGYTSTAPETDLRFAAEVLDSITFALQRMPKLTRLHVDIVHPVRFDRPGLDRMRSGVLLEVPPRDDLSARRDGRLILDKLHPTQSTLDQWQDIAQRQWFCKLKEADAL